MIYFAGPFVSFSLGCWSRLPTTAGVEGVAARLGGENSQAGCWKRQILSLALALPRIRSSAEGLCKRGEGASATGENAIGDCSALANSTQSQWGELGNDAYTKDSLELLIFFSFCYFFSF